MHYFGIAVCKDGTPVDELMRKFDDNLCVEWVDAREHERFEYENGTMRMFKMPDGSYKSPYNGEFAVKEEGPTGILMTRFVCPEGCEDVEVPRKVAYPDYDKYLIEWCGYFGDPERGIGSWDNPNGHYDYYRIGGRWSGGIAATKGDRVEYCWEIESWTKDHPGEPWYKEHQFDVADVEDMIRSEQHAPAFFVTPEGEWLNEDAWGGAYGVFNETVDHCFWEMCIEPLLGYGGYTAYVIDAHN